MRRPPSHSLLGPALVLYLVADAAAEQGARGGVFVIMAVGCGLLSLTPFWTRRELDEPGARRVGWLGLGLACALLPGVAPFAHGFPVFAASVLGAGASAALLIDLTLTQPETVLPLRAERHARVMAWAVALLAAGLGLATRLPPVWLDGRPWVVLPWVAQVPFACLLGALIIALAGRIARGRAGGEPALLASNTWGILGLAPALLLALGAAIARAFGAAASHPDVRVAALASALLIVPAHVRLLDPALRSSVGSATRRIVPAGLTLVALGAAAVLMRSRLPESSLLLAATTAAVALLALALHALLRDVAGSVLAPDTVRTLSALQRAVRELSRVRSLDQVARAALGAARRASGDPRSEPVLYLFDPEAALRLDAAGFAHRDALPLHSEIVAALRAAPTQILLPPEAAECVRSKALRPLGEALAFVNARCIVPLHQQGELEGALLMPGRVGQRAPTLEELEALLGFGEHLAGLAALLCAEARAARRREDAERVVTAAETARTRAEGELARGATRMAALQAGGALAPPTRLEVAYSPAMRALLDQLSALAESQSPVLFLAEPGTPVAPLMRRLHEASLRPGGPFLAGDCSALADDRAEAFVLGGPNASDPSWMQLAEGGTLALFELVALPQRVQRLLADRMGVAALSRGEPSARITRVLASCRIDPQRPGAVSALDPELLARFSCVRVPPLRERAADLASLTLLALDRSARLLGRPAVGIAEDAQARLAAYAFPGNLDELDAIIARAVSHCRSTRITALDLPPLDPRAVSAGLGDESALDGTLEEVERRALERALSRAGGNKAEAARSLGLKRSTFQDKLRRHGLDAPKASLVHN